MKKIISLVIVLLLAFLAACGNGGAADETEELAVLEVEFMVPETADPRETVELEAVVTYGGEAVEDADEVVFEYWLLGHEGDSSEVEATHAADGSYVADVVFPEDGVYEIYAHTTAKGIHTMPLKSIVVGKGEEAATVNGEHEEHTHQEQTDGFHLHFVNHEAVGVNEVTELVVHLQLGEEALSNANVRYEISPEGSPENTEWVDAEETITGEYAAEHEFTEAGTYTVVIHVEDGADLHEHDEYTIEVD